MANRNEIINRITELKTQGQDIVRREYLSALNAKTGNDTIVYAVPFTPRVPGLPDSVLQINRDDIQGFMTCLNGLKGDKLDLILHSPGGQLEAADQIVQYLRAKYAYIRAFIPQNAMSAATMLACACDEIVFGKESAIRPIDPQMAIQGQSIPAHSILVDFERAKSEIANDINAAKVWIPKLNQIPVGFLDHCQKAIALSKSKVAEWLDSYMFKNDPIKRGQAIAEWLGNFEEHKTHGRPINYDLAKSKGLKVSLLEDDQELQDGVLSVYHATLVTFDMAPCVKIVENHNGKGAYVVVQAPTLPQVIM